MPHPLTRRDLALLMPALATRPAVAELPTPAPYRWRILREGSEIGSHVVTFTRRGEDVVAHSDLSVTPRVLGVVVYRYEHRYREVTRGGRFVSVESWHNRNGRIVEARAQAQPDAVLLEGPGGSQRLPADAAPMSWWEGGRFGRVPLFGTTEPRLLNLRMRREPRPGGGLILQLAGDVEARVEYDALGRWVGYAVRGDDGSLVTYAPA
ncbi:MAG: DUF6134 family protein [Rhodovarius sp.]|nr:DUF6134 family protein [Rhodovarius sp.]MCX7931553.1 DUF6134 family protein [Rhodovarius sp.]MDW8314861.1 DUF6134 family protein [Rhodovarius sp.]